MKKTAVKTATFGRGFVVHEVASGNLTYCRIDVVQPECKISRHPATSINCFICKRLAKRLRPRPGKRLTATLPGLKVHVVSGAKTSPCNLNFSRMPHAVKIRPNAYVTCGHCMRFAWQ